MKRDWELVRQILWRMEALGDTRQRLQPHEVPGYDAENVSYHLQLLDQAGLIRCECSSTISAPLCCFGITLTWAGHEFLDTVKPAGVWQAIGATARAKGLDLSFGVIKALAEGVTKGML